MPALGSRPRSILTMANLDLPTDAAVTLLFLVNGRMMLPGASRRAGDAHLSIAALSDIH